MLEIRDLHVRFHNRDREAVSGVSLTIRAVSYTHLTLPTSFTV